MKARHWTISALPALLLAAVIAAGTYHALAADPAPPAIEFYGRVIDEAGEPVEGAEVGMLIWSERSVKPNQSADELTRWITRRSGPDGTFAVINERGAMLWVQEVNKPGRRWIVDWAWAPFHDPNVLLDNRYFVYGGQLPLYIPDKFRPAVLPMHREGSLVLGRPSRGGADHYPDGRIVRNEPVTPRIPSAGPGAPATGVEQDRMIQALARELGITRATTTPAG